MQKMLPKRLHKYFFTINGGRVAIHFLSSAVTTMPFLKKYECLALHPFKEFADGEYQEKMKKIADKCRGWAIMK